MQASDFGYVGQALLFQHPKITQAIIDTKDLVLMHNGQVFPTTFSVDAGGYNAQFDSIFRKKTDAPIGTKLPSDHSIKWAKTFSKQALCEILNISDVKNLAFYKDQLSQKNYAVKVTDTKGSKVILIDRFIEICDLKSNDFDLKLEKDKFVFEGKGDGLGVGLCLKTAEVLAKQGQDFKAILQACYPETEINVLKN
jgi:SpoIID/LytB domain protein